MVRANQEALGIRLMYNSSLLFYLPKEDKCILEEDSNTRVNIRLF